MHETPDISAVILLMTDDEREYAPKTLGSVLAQTLPVGEILVYVREENTWIDAIVQGQPKITVRRIPKMGPGHVRNLAAREARGEWLAYLDGDDYWAPTRLERQCAGLSSHDGLISCDYYLINERGVNCGFAMSNRFPTPSSWLIRRRIMLEKRFNETVFKHNDSMWWVEHRGWEITRRVPEPLLFYRVRRGSLSDVLKNKQRKNQYVALASHPLVRPLAYFATWMVYRGKRATTYPPAA
ncbi:glycosyltransferase family 2 protein [Paludibacterium paludis]|uniref:Glycosyltransferase 2-like domain-containing protein n=1 Tax=Paludibacterium paludis TaxID=1225769 RepID=A0A918P3T6_9NEIS|nr:glycosyltransferase family A protein [Paludibacterium paludis]GGY15606.1 hypothetical protein GCM10011289_18640 [Paludibacterium paludis]